MKRLFLLLFLLPISFGVFAQKTQSSNSQKSKINIYQALDSTAYAEIYHHGSPTTWIINSKIKFSTRKIILNPNHIDSIKIENPNILVKYKFDSVEILTLPQLLEKYCKLSLEKEKLLIKTDDELERYPSNIYIAIDAIKELKIDNSDHYPSLKAPKDSFKIIDIRTYKPGEKERSGEANIRIQ